MSAVSDIHLKAVQDSFVNKVDTVIDAGKTRMENRSCETQIIPFFVKFTNLFNKDYHLTVMDLM